MNSLKRLIVNADDYGVCREVNAAIEQLAEAGLLGGVSVLANGAAWEQAANFLRDHPAVSAGVHFNAVEGRPVSTAPEVNLLTGADRKFAGLAGLLKRWMLRPIAVSRAVEIEWRAQIERLLQARVRLTHADSHQHLHAFPPAFRCAARLCGAYGIWALRWPRECSGAPTRRAGTLALSASLTTSRAITAGTALRHNDHFLGFKRAGVYGLAELVEDLAALPDGLTELALHPSVADGMPYHQLRGDTERRAMLNASFLDHLARLKIERLTWEMVAA